MKSISDIAIPKEISLNYVFFTSYKVGVKIYYFEKLNLFIKH